LALTDDEMNVAQALESLQIALKHFNSLGSKRGIALCKFAMLKLYTNKWKVICQSPEVANAKDSNFLLENQNKALESLVKEYAKD